MLCGITLIFTLSAIVFLLDLRFVRSAFYALYAFYSIYDSFAAAVLRIAAYSLLNCSSASLNSPNAAA